MLRELIYGVHDSTSYDIKQRRQTAPWLIGARKPYPVAGVCVSGSSGLTIGCAVSVRCAHIAVLIRGYGYSFVTGCAPENYCF